MHPGAGRLVSKPSKSGSWDHDCSGADEFETKGGTCAMLLTCPLCGAGSPGYVGAPAACGQSGQVGSSCGCNAGKCQLMATGSKQQRCR